MEQALVTIVSSGFGAAIMVFILRTWFVERLEKSIAHEYAKQLEQFKLTIEAENKTRQEIWLMKKDACLRALNLANAVLSNHTYPNVPAGAILPQFVSIDEARAVFNELACTCETGDVIGELKRIMFE